MMKDRRGRAPSVAAMLLSLACACGGGSPRTRQDAKFDALVAFARAEIARQGVPGAAIAVVVDGKLKYQAGVGTKRVGREDPVRADTLFAIGSATKMLTAAGVLTLRDEGKLDLDAPITEYVPSFQLAGAEASRTSDIHVRQLLSHSAGLPDEGPPTVCAQSLSEWIEDEAHRVPLWYEPGRLWDYSNLGYAVAGLALERLSGRPFADAMKERIFDPLDMGSATFDPSVARGRDHSLGHVPGSQGDLQPVEVDSRTCPALGPEGGRFFATAGDMARFAQALLADGAPVLEPASVEAMEGRQMETHEFPGETYGFGLFSFEAQGVRHLYHGGDTTDFNSMVVLVPQRKFAVVVLFNRDTGGSGLVAAKAVELFLGITAQPDPDWLTPPSSWAKYTGEYYEPFGLHRLIVTLENDKLLLEAADLDPGHKMEMSQTAADAFVLSDPSVGQVPVTFWFEGDPRAAKYMVTRQLGVAVRPP
jgi:CubicO group peptidase (beta-lactamase class C family)